MLPGQDGVKSSTGSGRIRPAPARSACPSRRKGVARSRCPRPRVPRPPRPSRARARWQRPRSGRRSMLAGDAAACSTCARAPGSDRASASRTSPWIAEPSASSQRCLLAGPCRAPLDLSRGIVRAPRQQVRLGEHGHVPGVGGHGGAGRPTGRLPPRGAPHPRPRGPRQRVGLARDRRPRGGRAARSWRAGKSRCSGRARRSRWGNRPGSGGRPAPE